MTTTIVSDPDRNLIAISFRAYARLTARGEARCYGISLPDDLPAARVVFEQPRL
jgi:hypothetical protein